MPGNFVWNSRTTATDSRLKRDMTVLGFAGMRERVEEMGGELRIVSARGKGTKIALVLLLDRGLDVMKSEETKRFCEGSRKKKVSATKARRLARKDACIRVLIADDHSVVREGLVSLIGRRADMAVVGEASNGREAVDLWKKHQPDVTLLDLRMPELDGVGAINEIRD